MHRTDPRLLQRAASRPWDRALSSELLTSAVANAIHCAQRAARSGSDGSQAGLYLAAMYVAIAAESRMRRPSEHFDPASGASFGSIRTGTCFQGHRGGSVPPNALLGWDSAAEHEARLAQRIPRHEGITSCRLLRRRLARSPVADGRGRPELHGKSEQATHHYGLEGWIQNTFLFEDRAGSFHGLYY